MEGTRLHDLQSVMSYELRLRDDVIALGCLAIAFMLCVGVAFAQSSGPWLLSPHPAPEITPSLSPEVTPWPSGPKVPKPKAPETFIRTVDGIEFVIKTVDGEEKVIKHIVRGNPGGWVTPNLLYWIIIGANGTEVEIRGPCVAAALDRRMVVDGGQREPGR